MRPLWEAIQDSDDKILNRSKDVLGKNQLEMMMLLIINPVVELMHKYQCKYNGQDDATNVFSFEEKDHYTYNINSKEVRDAVIKSIESSNYKDVMKIDTKYVLFIDFIDEDMRKKYHRSDKKYNDQYALNVEVTFHSGKCFLNVFGNNIFIRTFEKLLDKRA